MAPSTSKTATTPAGRGKNHRPAQGNGSPNGSTRKRNANGTSDPCGQDGWSRIVITGPNLHGEVSGRLGWVREDSDRLPGMKPLPVGAWRTWNARAELVKGKVLTAAEDAVIGPPECTLAEHVAAFVASARTPKGLSRVRI